jgi:hypothetical protein
MDGVSVQQLNQPMGRNGLFIFFRALNFMPYIAIGLLIIVVAIWIIFGIKKFRWAKILAIVLTVLVVITGGLSLGTLFLSRRFMGGSPPEGEQFQRFEERENSVIEENGSASLTKNIQIAI